MSYDARRIGEYIDDYNFRKQSPRRGETSATLVKATRGLEGEERDKIINFAEKKGIADWKIEKEFVPVYKKSDDN